MVHALRSVDHHEFSVPAVSFGYREKLSGGSRQFVRFYFEDRLVQKAVTSQVPLMIAFPDSVAARCIDRIAHALAFGEEAPAPKGIRGLFHRLLAR